ncbi:MAG: DNA primase [Actinomycetota bacterium]|nr:DNA primase [Actinomycetota bacterium]MED5232873.1 DNA primase [Actinomycetota bacterium]
MGIVDEDVRRVRDETDIVRIVTEHTQLKKTGAQWMGLCPFHGEKSPSFSVNAEKGVYYCFGCQVSGDVIDFVREVEGLDFAGSVEFLAAKAGIPLRYTDHNEGRRRNRRKEHAEIVQKAVDFYHERLLTDPDARPARDYLRSRGYAGDVARRFSIGWAPDDWSELSDHLKLSDADLQATGLGGINRRGGQYDFFRARIVFPIFDAQGNPIGFGGRKLPDGEGPKYKNTSDAAEYYSKSEVLYGLHWAKAEAGRIDELVVCEGYTDVIGCHLSGIERAVATCGTALTPNHARLMGRFAKRVVLAFDADGAGQAAAERVYAWEEEFGLRFAVAALPPGADPGDLAGSDPEGLRAAIEGARPFLEFRVDRVLDRGDLGSAEGRAAAATEAMGLVVEHPDALVRDQYAMRIADRCLVGVDEVRRRGDAAAPGRLRGVVVSGTTTGGVEGGAGRLTSEVQALRLMVHRPDEVRHLLVQVLFDDPVHQATFSLLAEATDLHEAREAAEGAVADLLGRLAVADASDEDPLGVLTRLCHQAAERAVVALEAEARQTGDLASYQPSISFLRTEVIRLREVVPEGEGASLEPLLRWLVDYSGGRVDV